MYAGLSQKPTQGITYVTRLITKMNFVSVNKKFVKLLAENAMIRFTLELNNLACFTNKPGTMKRSIIDINTNINYFL